MCLDLRKTTKSLLFFFGCRNVERNPANSTGSSCVWFEWKGKGKTDQRVEIMPLKRQTAVLRIVYLVEFIEEHLKKRTELLPGIWFLHFMSPQTWETQHSCASGLDWSLKTLKCRKNYEPCPHLDLSHICSTARIRRPYALWIDRNVRQPQCFWGGLRVALRRMAIFYRP